MDGGKKRRGHVRVSRDSIVNRTDNIVNRTNNIVNRTRQRSINRTNNICQTG